MLKTISDSLENILDFLIMALTLSFAIKGLILFGFVFGFLH